MNYVNTVTMNELTIGMKVIINNKHLAINHMQIATIIPKHPNDAYLYSPNIFAVYLANGTTTYYYRQDLIPYKDTPD